jgi:hypothetical protein
VPGGYFNDWSPHRSLGQGAPSAPALPAFHRSDQAREISRDLPSKAFICLSTNTEPRQPRHDLRDDLSGEQPNDVGSRCRTVSRRAARWRSLAAQRRHRCRASCPRPIAEYCRAQRRAPNHLVSFGRQAAYAHLNWSHTQHCHQGSSRVEALREYTWDGARRSCSEIAVHSASKPP